MRRAATLAPLSLALAGLAAAGAAQPPPAWSRAHAVMARTAHAMVYDELRGRTVLFGGMSGPFANGDTWEWDGSAWTQRAPGLSPPPRTGHALAYDLARGRVVLFGGGTEQAVDSQTWEWDGDSWQFRTLVGPAARAGHCLAYDIARQRTVLFGGQSPPDTWEWDGIAWTPIVTANAPGARRGAAMAYDLARARTVLFGGAPLVAAPLLGDTWTYDGVNWTLAAPTSGAAPRRAAGMVFDASAGRVVLHGGDNGAVVTFLADTWEWTGSTWVQRATASPPPGRQAAGLAYDTARARLVLHGGAIFDRAVGDTWEAAGTTWTRIEGSAPHARYGHALASDTARGRVVLFGGRLPTWAQAAQNDTWEWDGYRWHEALPATAPPARHQHTMAYDGARQLTVLFGGLLPSTGLGAADTWTWNGSNWTQLAPAASPPARSGHVMAYDAARQQVLLFSGTAGNDTWTWDGVNWTQQFPLHSPAVRQDAGLADDAARQVVVLYGGWLIAAGSAIGDTWEWNGVDWTLRGPIVSPGVRVMHAMAYDAARQRVEVVGGYTALFSGAQLNDNWEYDGVRWTQIAGTGPRPSFEHAMAYDAIRRQLLLFGGVSSTNDVWFYGNTLPARLDPTGAGCPGSNGVPVLATSAPYLGARGSLLELLGAAPVAPAGIGLSFAPAAVALGGGCTLWLGPLATAQLVVTSAVGAARVPLPVPEQPALRGLVVYAQAAVLDGASPIGLAFTGGRRLIVGD